MHARRLRLFGCLGLSFPAVGIKTLIGARKIAGVETNNRFAEGLRVLVPISADIDAGQRFTRICREQPECFREIALVDCEGAVSRSDPAIRILARRQSRE